jgi:hypothetical protein
MGFFTGEANNLSATSLTLGIPSRMGDSGVGLDMEHDQRNDVSA